MKESSRALARVSGFSVVLLLVLLSNSSSAYAQIPHLQDSLFDRIVTQTAYSQLPLCNAPNCVPLAEGGQAYISDYAVVEGVTISAAHDQEVFKWQALRPDNTTVVLATLTFVSYANTVRQNLQ